jgi:putative transposase
MLVFEFKAYGKKQQLDAIDEAIRTVQFIRNKALRFWMENQKVDKYDLNKYSAVLAKEWTFCDDLNSMARQSSSERAWSAISRFYDNCKKKFREKRDFRSSRKTTARSNTRLLAGVWQTTEIYHFYRQERNRETKIKRNARLTLLSAQSNQASTLGKRADGYYVQFCIQVDRSEKIEVTGNAIGLDVGPKSSIQTLMVLPSRIRDFWARRAQIKESPKTSFKTSQGFAEQKKS